MQNIRKIKISFPVLALAFVLAFFAFTSTAFAQASTDHTGTIRICSVLANTSGALASADTTVPVGTFSLSLFASPAATVDLSSPITTHTFNPQAFAHNTMVDGVPMHCTDTVAVPFGQYYYNNVASMGSAWSPSKYFDSTSTFSLSTASSYTNGFFTTDSSDDVLVNIASDGLITVNETTPNRTVVIVNSYETSQGQTTTPPVNAFCANGVSLTYPEFVHARTSGVVSYVLTTDIVTNKATVELSNTTGCTIPMSLSAYKMFDGSHLSTQQYFSGTPEIQATSTTTFSIKIPTCLAQVDFWYGTAPTILVDNYNYGDLPLPVVLVWDIPRITGVGAGGVIEGPYCSHAANTAPTITLVGSNPTLLTVGDLYTEPGATAHDAEDGNITNNIVITGTVGTTPGTYTRTYSVTDSEGLSASTTRTVIVLPVAACVAHTNMISNAGFEAPVINHPLKWGSVILGTPGLEWTSFDTVYPYVELQAGYTEGNVQWMPHSGIQYAEIDGGTNHDVSQVLATIPGNSYTLSYWASPRPNQSTATNVMNISFNGQLIDTYIGVGSVMTDWSNRSYTFTATTTTTRISFTQGQNAHIGEGVFLDDVSVICNPTIAPVNTPPTITLIGANPATITVGQAWVEPGATATDLEDGNITNNIVITGTVGTTPGTYTRTYSVTDSGGLSASTTRQVIVSPLGGGGATTGTISFCSIYANKENVVATSATGLPAGTFSIKLASTTDIASSTIQSKTWTASAFAPNRKIISGTNDADCVTYTDLPFATYYYSELGVSGTGWIVSTTSPKYNDQLTTPVNNVFDFFQYSPELFNATSTDDVSRNVNADGQIVLDASRREHTLVLLTKYEPVVTPPICTVNCGGGGGGTPACTSNCGGGGGGGGNGPIVSSLTITNEKVVEITPGVALVTWNTNLPATKEVGYGNASQPASFIVSPFGYATSTPRVSSPLSTVHSYTIAIEPGKTYYFRPVSTDFKTTVAGIELVLNPGTGIGGGGGSPTSCYYLFDWLKKGWNNNPVEVKKLQVFLRDLEGYPVQVTGIYDDQTIVSLNAFQMRYKTDVLTPWGHTAPTSFTYITTKKKVNEIYCKMAFPVTALEQKEIDAYRAFLQGLHSAGITVGAPTVEQLNKPPFIETTEVGVLPGLSTSTPVIPVTQVTLAGTEANSTTTVAGRLTASVIASSKKVGNFMAALFTWPWDWAKGWFGGSDELECAPTSVFSNWFNWILLIIILTMAYLWYRERRDNKRANKLNEEIDLVK